MKYCRNCGRKASDDTAFCGNCGTPFIVPSGATETQMTGGIVTGTRMAGGTAAGTQTTGGIVTGTQMAGGTAAGTQTTGGTPAGTQTTGGSVNGTQTIDGGRKGKRGRKIALIVILICIGTMILLCGLSLLLWNLVLRDKVSALQKKNQNGGIVEISIAATEKESSAELTEEETGAANTAAEEETSEAAETTGETTEETEGKTTVLETTVDQETETGKESETETETAQEAESAESEAPAESETPAPEASAEAQGGQRIPDYNGEYAIHLSSMADYMYLDIDAESGSIKDVWYLVPDGSVYQVVDIFGNSSDAVSKASAKELLDAVFTGAAGALPNDGGHGCIIWNSPYGPCKYDHGADEYAAGAASLKYTLTDSVVKEYIADLSLPEDIIIPSSSREN